MVDDRTNRHVNAKFTLSVTCRNITKSDVMYIKIIPFIQLTLVHEALVLSCIWRAEANCLALRLAASQAL